MNNYRPISIQPTFYKVLEKVVYNRLSGYLDKLDILVPSGFGKTEHNLYGNTQLILVLKREMWWYFLGPTVSKAFDTNDFDILLHKLH